MSNELPAPIVQKAQFWFEQLSHRPIEDRMRAALNVVHNDVRQFYDAVERGNER